MIKKLCVAILSVLAIWSTSVGSASAAGFSLSITGDSVFTNPVTLYIRISGSASTGGACGGVCGVSGFLSYDKNKLEMTSVSALQGLDLVQGAPYVLSKTSGVADGNILSMVFRNKGLADGESTTISFTGIVGSNGDDDITAGNTSKTIQYKAPVVTPPTNNNTGGTTKNPTSSKQQPVETQPVSVEDPIVLDSNASLQNIEFDAEILTDFHFNKDILNYDLIVGAETDKINIAAVSESAKAKISGAGEQNLDYGKNTLKITITAEDNSTKEYVFNVFREEKIVEEKNNIIPIIILSVALVASVVFNGVLLRRYCFKKKRNKATKQDNEE